MKRGSHLHSTFLQMANQDLFSGILLMQAAFWDQVVKGVASLTVPLYTCVELLYVGPWTVGSLHTDKS
jgi:hypothetical protein